MVELLVFLLTVTPAVLGAIHGYRVGGACLIARWAPIALSWPVGVSVAYLFFRAGIFVPFGLATPVVLGIVFATAAALMLRRSRRLRAERVPARTGLATRLAGAFAGGVGGLAVASSSWIGLVAIDAWNTAAPGSSPRTTREGTGPWLHSLVRTANRGLLRHLPVVGQASDEIDALLYVLNADPELRAHLARQRGWGKLRRLPSFRAILEDAEIRQEIDSVSEGNLAALYRLQKNRKVIAFVGEENVQAILAEVRPSALARELARLEAGAPVDTGGSGPRRLQSPASFR